MWLLVALASLSAVRALSSWYTEPSGIPAGSVSGDKIRGVDLGGWFILVSSSVTWHPLRIPSFESILLTLVLQENWMMPDLFAVSPLDQQIVPDEVRLARVLNGGNGTNERQWTYCSVLGKEECVSRLTTHWDSYVTEDDFKRFAN